MAEFLNPTQSENYYPRNKRRLARFCLRQELQKPDVPRNNDALAHVYLLSGKDDLRDVEAQIYDEFITDISERSKDEHFYGEFSFEFNGQDFMSNAGLSLLQILESGRRAAIADGIDYGIDRANVLIEQMKHLISWANSDDKRQIAFFSLCPDAHELPRDIADSLSFKQERLMSSNWLFEKDDSGLIRMHAFSLDNHTLDRHRSIVSGEPVAATTLIELGTPRYYDYSDGTEAVEQIRSKYDQDFGTYFGKYDVRTTSANHIVSGRPEAYDFYYEALWSTREALEVGRVTSRYRRLLSSLRSGFSGFDAPLPALNKKLWRPLTSNDAAEVMEYIRRQAIPHYLYGGVVAGVSIAESGAIATTKQITYDSACPTSVLTPREEKALEQSRLEIVFFGRPPKREKYFDSYYCPCCLPKPIVGQSVKAWMGEGFIGCEDCGHIVDVCGIVLRQGNLKRRIEKTKKICAKKSASRAGRG